MYLCCAHLSRFMQHRSSEVQQKKRALVGSVVVLQFAHTISCRYLRALAHMVDAICLAQCTRAPRSTVFPRKLSLSTAGTDMARTLHKQLTPTAVLGRSSGRWPASARPLQEEQHEIHDS